MYQHYGPDWLAARWVRLIHVDPDLLTAFRTVQQDPTQERFKAMMEKLIAVPEVYDVFYRMSKDDLKQVMQRVFIMIDSVRP